MRIIRLDGTRWQSGADFYAALLPEIGAPDWHGRNLDALEESLRAGDVFPVKPPVTIHIVGMATMTHETRTYLDRFQALAVDLRADGVAVNVTLTE